MSETNTQDQVETNSTTVATLYATRAECQAAKPSDAAKSLRAWEVSKDGSVLGWVLGRGYDQALAALARKDGYSVSTGAKTVQVTKEVIASRSRVPRSNPPPRRAHRPARPNGGQRT